LGGGGGGDKAASQADESGNTASARAKTFLHDGKIGHKALILPKSQGHRKDCDCNNCVTAPFAVAASIALLLRSGW
jgi:hypothetical protein